MVFDPRDVDSKYCWDMPSLAFLLHHPIRDEYLLFDLGIRKDYLNYPPVMVRMIEETLQPIRTDPDIADKLRAGGLDLSKVTYVIISHAHWDHTGDPTLFPSSTFVVGEGTQALVARGYPADPNSKIPQDLLPADRTRVLADADARWAPLGPFPRALDFFGDGSVFVVDAPGHLPGHINLLARTSADGGWIYLAGDACHDYKLLTGAARMAMRTDEHGHGHCIMHTDLAAAETHIARMLEVRRGPRVRLLLAHDVPWYEETKGEEGFWPRQIKSL